MKKFLLSFVFVLSSYSWLAAQGPAIVEDSYNPANGATDVPVDADLTFVFSEKVQKGNNNILIKEGTRVVETIAINSNAVDIVNDSIVVIKPLNDFEPSGNISVQINANTFESLAGDRFAGNSDQPWAFQAARTAAGPPTVATYSPANGTSNIRTDQNLTLTFSDNVLKGASGKIILYNGAAKLDSLNISSANVTITGAQLTINPLTNLPAGQTIAVQITPGALISTDSSAFVGINDNTTWSFTTDGTLPTVSQFTPAPAAVNVRRNDSLQIKFSEKIKKGTGTIIIRSKVGSTTIVLETIVIATAPASVVSVIGDSTLVVVKPQTNFPSSALITVEISNGAFLDLSNNAYAGTTTGWSFQVEDTVAPGWQSFTPVNGVSGVSRTANIVVVFNEKVKKGTIGNITIRNNGLDIETIAVASAPVGVISITDSIVTINPVNTFPSGGNISVVIQTGAFEDLSGNSYSGNLPANPWAFTVQNTSPVIVTNSYSPANGASNIQSTADLTFTFSRKVQKGSGNIVIRNGSAIVETIPVSSSIVSIVTDSIIRINPTLDFPSSANISISLEAGIFEDLNGEIFIGNVASPWQFTVEDYVVPTIIANSYSPVNGATNVSATANLTLRFSEKLRKGSGNIVIRNGSTILETIPVSSSIVSIATDSVVTINPTNDFPSLANISVTLAANTFEDLAGNKFVGNASLPWSFQIADIVPPALVVGSYSPANGGTGIAANADLVFRLSEKARKGTGNIVIRNGSAVLETISVGSAAVSIVTDSVVRINPAVDFPSSANMSVSLEAGTFEDLAGNKFAGNTAAPWRFTVVDYANPTVVNTAPVDNATGVLPTDKLQLFFSEKVKKGASGTITIDKGSVNQGIPLSSSAIVVTDSIVTITPPTSLPINTYISVQITPGAFLDLANNAYAGIADTVTWNFRTVTDVNAPTDTQLSPQDDSTQVPVNKKLVITFSEKIVKQSGGSVLIIPSIGNPQTIPVSSPNVVISGTNSNIVTITPLQNLPSGAEVYVLVLPNSFADEAGNAYAGFTDPGKWNFTVVDNVRPVATISTPKNGDAGVSANPSLIVTFSEAIKRGTGNITISQGTGNPTLSIDITDTRYVNISGTLLVITLPSSLASGATASVQIPGTSITDLSGNAFAGIAAGAWSFTVADTQAPVIVTSSLDPANGATNVARTKVLRVTFNERVKKGTGSILISENGVLTPVAVSNANVSITNNTNGTSTVAINYSAIKSGGFASGAGVFVLIPYGAFADSTGNLSLGIPNPTDWSFTITDDSKPEVSQTLPANGTTVASATNLSITFSEAIKAGTGANNKITIYQKGVVPTLLETIAANNTSKVLINDKTVTILTNAFPNSGVEIYVNIESGAFIDNSGNAFAGFSTPTQWFFNVTDTQGPLVDVLNPENGKSNVRINDPLVITFKEPVRKGTSGKVLIFSKQVAPQTIELNQITVPNNSSTTATIAHANFQSNDTVYVLIFPGTFTDLAGNSFEGISSEQTWSFKTADILAPVATFVPENGSTGVALDKPLTITFNEEVRKTATGAISIYRDDTDALLQTIPVADTLVKVISKQVVSIRLKNNLPTATKVYIKIDSTAFTDVVGNRYKGIYTKTGWSFTTIDLTAPEIVSYLPTRGAINQPTSTNLTFKFNKQIKQGTGNIRLKVTGITPDVVIPVTNAAVSIRLDQQTVDVSLSGFFPNGIPSGAVVSVTMDDGVFTDLANGNKFPGIPANNPWTFTVNDVVAPTLALADPFDPADNKTNVSINTALRITFSEPVKAGSGKLYIYRTSNPTTPLITLNASQGTGFPGATIRYTLPQALPSEASLHVKIDNNAFTDLANLPFEGISNPDTWNFTTTDITAPKVETYSPATNTTVSVSQPLVLTFNELVKKGTEGSITVNNGSEVQQININDATFSSNGTRGVVTFNRSFSFQSGQRISVRIPAGLITDVSGNAYAGIASDTVWSFTAIDNIAPRVVQFLPDTNAVGQLPTVKLRLTFNERVKQGSGTIVISQPGKNITVPNAGITITNNETTVNLPNAAFTAGLVTVTILPGTFTDLAGNPYAGIANWSFTVADIEAPRVFSTKPAAGETNVRPDEILLVTFTEKIEKNTGNIVITPQGGSPQTIAINTSRVNKINDNTISIQLLQNLPSGAFVNVSIPDGAFLDVENNRSVAYQWNFTVADVAAPTIKQLSPQDDTVRVARNRPLTITFSEPVLRGQGNVSIYVNSTLKFTPSVQDLVLAGASVTIVPQEQWPSNAKVYVLMPEGAFKDAAGNKAGGITDSTRWNFTIEDYTAPTIEEYSPITPPDAPITTNVTLTFSEPVKAGTGTITLRPSVGTSQSIPVANASIRVVNGQGVVTIDPQNFGSNVSVDVTIPAGSFTDLEGNALAAPLSWTFKVVDTDIPSVDIFSPKEDSTNVPINKKLQMLFNKEVRKNTGTISIVVNNKTYPIAVTSSAVSLSNNRKTVTIDPFSADLPAFPSEAVVYVTMPSGVFVDLSSSANRYPGISSPTTWSFTIADVNPPTVDEYNPKVQATSVPVNKEIVLIMSEAIRVGSSQDSVTITQSSGTIEKIAITDAKVRILNGREVHITHAKPFDSEATVTVQLPRSSIKDFSGNLLAAPISWSFKAADIVPPTARLTPANGQTGIAITSPLVITFNEVVTKLSGTIVLSQTGSVSPIVVSGESIKLETIKEGNKDVTQATITHPDFQSGATVSVIMFDNVFADLAGNRFAGYGYSGVGNWSFTVADITDPYINNTSPFDEQANVSPETDLIITFSEKMKRGKGAVNLYFSSTISIDVSNTKEVIMEDGTSTVRIKTSAILPSNDRVTVEITKGAFTDMEGNPFELTDRSKWNFTIADFVNPRIVKRDPLIGAGNVAQDKILGLTFDKPILPGAGLIKIFRIGNDRPLAEIDVRNAEQVKIDTNDPKTVRIIPGVTLPSGTTVYVTIEAGAFVDLNRNEFLGLGVNDWNFTVKDLTEPRASTRPQNNETNVAPDTPLQLLFNETVTQVPDKKIYVEVNGIVRDSVLATNTQLATLPNGTRVTIPVRAFGSEDRVVIRIPRGAFVDLAGNPFAGYTTSTGWAFTIADVTEPTASNFTPRDQSGFIKIDTVLSLTFSEPIRKASGFFIFLNEVSATGNNTRPISVDDPAVTIVNQRTVQIRPPGGLPYRTQITVQIPKGAFVDSSGNAFKGVGVEGAVHRWSFNTVPPPDFTPPQKESFSPEDESVDVPVTSELSITFSEPVSAGANGTITISYAPLDNPGNIQISETLQIRDGERVRFQRNSPIVKFKPSGNLPANANVSIQITEGAIVDSVGNKYEGIANVTDWNFLTSDPTDTIPPVVNLLDPLDGSSNVPVSKNFRIVFSKPMRLGRGNIILDDNGEKRIIPINSSQVSLSGSVLTINPDKDLAPGANVNIQIPGEALTDRSGNRFRYDGKQGMPDPQDWNFSTFNNTITDGPLLDRLFPGPGEVAKASTNRLTLVFNRKMKIYEGTILIRQNGTLTSLSVLNPAVSVDAKDSTRINLDFPAGFPAGAAISIVIPSSAFVDIHDNSFEGFPESNPWQFTIEDKDPPKVVRLYPKPNTVVPKNTNLIVEFDEPIKILNKDILITILGVSPGLQIPLSDPRVRVYNNILEVNLTGDLVANDDSVRVSLGPGGLADLSNNPFKGIVDGEWRFKLGNFIDNVAPQLSEETYDPAPNRKNVDNAKALSVTFNEPIQKGKGTIKLVVDGVTRSIDVTDPQVSVRDSLLVIKPATPFPYLARVSVLIDSSAITDLADNKFKGIYNSATWSFTIEKEPPVSLILQSPASLDVHDTTAQVDLTATISERRPGITAKFYYRGITTPSDTIWQVKTLPLVGLSYTATLSKPQIEADPIGVEYYYELEFDSTFNTNPLRSDTQYVYRYYIGHGQRIPRLTAGSSIRNYYILSIPLDLKAKEVSQVFGDDLQIYDTKKWRIFHFNEEEQANEEYQAGLTTIESGKGYWFISRNQKALDTLDTGEGSVVHNNRKIPFPLLLTKGWNQIGNPYNFDISWEDVLKANPELDSTDLNTYEGAYRTSTTLPKFRGGFVFVEDDIRIKIPTTQRRALNGGRVSEEKSAFVEGSLWEINFDLQAKETSYNLSGLGMHTFAQPGKDRLDRIALPRLPQHLDIRFDHPEHFAKYFAKDMVPVQDNYTWEFTAGSGFSAQDVTLTWNTKLPEVSDKQWILFDVQQNRAIDLTKQTEYKFWLDKSSLFRVYYGSPEYIREHMKPEFGSLGQIYPNPFSQRTTIPFALAKSDQPYQVKVDVFTLTGVKIATLTEGSFEPGLHEVAWDGRGFDGRRVAAGMYVCQMQVTSAAGQAVYRKKVILQ
jgi:methionine-rich copper-binding protein CopC